MIALLREHGIDYKTSNRKMSYHITNKQLQDIGNTYKWFFEDDDEEHDENRLIKTGEAVKLVMTSNEAKLQAEIDRLNNMITELKQVKQEVIPDDDDDDDDIEVINTNINMFNIPKQPEKIKKTQDMSNIISAFDNALFKMKS
jgi:seryl-tRNA synthetase